MQIHLHFVYHLSPQRGVFSGYELDRQGPDMTATLNKLDKVIHIGSMERFSNMGYGKDANNLS